MRKNKTKKTVAFHLLIVALLAVLTFFGCPIYRLLSFPCPCCGVTRAWLAFFSGDIAGAFAHHAMFFVIPATVWVFAHRGCRFFARYKRLGDVFLWLSCAALLIYYVIRVF